MQLRFLSVVGEALNFGSRRFETVAGIALLPVILLLLVNMVTVFAFLSVIAGRVITFTDVGSFAYAEQALTKYFTDALNAKPVEMLTIMGISFALQTILVSSFMAPLIRYAGLGEKPHRGLIRLPFGADQLRYILAGFVSAASIIVLILGPMVGASYFVLKYIFDGLSKTVASFPDPNSLHRIEFITTSDQLVSNGSAWYLNLGIPALASIPFVLILWFLIFSHFHPRNSLNSSAGGNPLLRGLVAFIAVGAAIGLSYWSLQEFILNAFKTVGSANKTLSVAIQQTPENMRDAVSSTLGTLEQTIANTPANAHVLIGAVILLLVGYVNLRLQPYPAIAVCRKSMGPGNTLRLSRGWNLIRLQLVLILVALFIFLVQTIFLNMFILTYLVPMVIGLLYQITAVSTKLINSGVTGEWVLPIFIWVWNGIKILVNILGMFFSYGVIAGLYGRLYRESEREESFEEQAPSGKAIWRRT